jgi:hypothetical protein
VQLSRVIRLSRTPPTAQPDHSAELHAPFLKSQKTVCILTIPFLKFSFAARPLRLRGVTRLRSRARCRPAGPWSPRVVHGASRPGPGAGRPGPRGARPGRGAPAPGARPAAGAGQPAAPPSPAGRRPRLGGSIAPARQPPAAQRPGAGWVDVSCRAGKRHGYK